MQVFSHESVFSELERTVFGVDGGCSAVSVLLLLVEARRPTSLTAVLTSKTLHSLSKSLPSNCSMFSWKQRRRHGVMSRKVRVRVHPRASAWEFDRTLSLVSATCQLVLVRSLRRSVVDVDVTLSLPQCAIVFVG